MPNTVIFRRSPRCAQGFTLIELMIVIAIIAVLAGIMIPNFVKAREESLRTAAIENMKSIGTALEMYAADNAGCYPVQLKKLTPDYLKAIPTCPYNNQSYYYSFTVNPNGYSLITPRITSSGKKPEDILYRNGQLDIYKFDE
ncbi:type II secretion system protein [bacterium]|nr:type II secretion system protein [bacterium]